MYKLYYLFVLICASLLISCTSIPTPSPKAPKVSVQLHSVRHAVSADFKNTLKQIADMGFEGVEFAGRYGPFNNDAKGLKSFLAEIGLETSGAHIPLSQLLGENSEQKLTFLQGIGAQLIVIPFDKRANNPDKIDELITDLVLANEKVNRYGMLLGYHNHSQEFEAYGTDTYWDYIAKNTPNNFVLQLDVGWANFANQNPIEYVKRYPLRTVTTHLKIRTYKGRPSKVDADKHVIIGQDAFDWTALVEANMEYGGTKWLVVEQEEYPKPLTPLESVNASLNGLNKALKDLETN